MKSPPKLLLALALLTLFPRAALALPNWLDPFARVEAGAAFPLRSPQSEYFNAGFGGAISVGLGLGEWFGVQLTGQPIVLPARDNGPNTEAAVPFGMGGGIRLKLPYRFVLFPWVDADLFYVRTGPFDRFGYTLGAGLHIPVGTNRIVRLGPFVRFFDVINSQASSASNGDAMTFIGGFSMEIGVPRSRHPDRDHDGVADADDRCPDQPGFPATFGCPDRDSDGIVDALDKCPDSPGGPATSGCPDSDGDGITDADDRCPRQPGPATFRGCPDTDGDGVADADDQCPTQAGPARAGGCPDRDGDTVADFKDSCPDVPGPVASEGCPDKDGDTVADIKDQCPDVAGTVATRGCPDKDGDKVADADDECPDAPGSISAHGCPDSDGDGIADSADDCPKEAGSVLAHGCPDRDGDTVADNDDQCPDRPGSPGHAGCPSMQAEAAQAGHDLAARVYFRYGHAELDGDRTVLDEVVQALQHNPGMKVRVEGHADDRGGDRYNLALSRARAEAVRAYVISHGVESRRLQVKGYGFHHPADRSPTDEGRERNRRVQFVVVR